MVLPGKKYLEAGKIYESEANFCANEKLLKYSAKSNNSFLLLSELSFRSFLPRRSLQTVA
jgi:hypothetical protein